ncbi:MAG: PD40 domain-containing protein [Anaerolineae bacterium]|nr:PD40 domain-containing protein [Anaerolineae bacterium]
MLTLIRLGLGVFIALGSVLTSTLALGRALPGGAQLAYATFGNDSNELLGALLDTTRAVSFSLSDRYAPSAPVGWLDRDHLLLAHTSEHYLLLTMGQGVRELTLPDACRSPLIWHGDLFACRPPIGGGVLIYSLACVLGPCVESPRWLAPGVDTQKIVWSPDGMRIAVAGWLQIGHAVSLLDVGSGSLTRLEARYSHTALAPAWSPDGTRIAICDGSDSARELRIVDVTAEPPTLVRAVPMERECPDAAPVWSPDGAQVMVVQLNARSADIVRVDLADGSVDRLNQSGGANLFPYWSEDGAQIVYYRGMGSFKALYLVDDANTTIRRLTDERVFGMPFVWRPCAAPGCGGR